MKFYGIATELKRMKRELNADDMRMTLIYGRRRIGKSELVAYDADAGKVKHYRVDKMLKMNIADEKRLGEEHFKNFDMGTYALENFSMFGGDIKRVHIEFPNDKVGIFIDRFGKDITIRKAGQDRSMIAVDVAVSLQFFGWIFSLGSDVKITGSSDVVNKVKDSAKGFLENYN